MPLYEYKCNHCDSEFELLRRVAEADKDVTCPVCGEQDVERQISMSSSNSGGFFSSFSPSSCTNFT